MKAYIIKDSAQIYLVSINPIHKGIGKEVELDENEAGALLSMQEMTSLFQKRLKTLEEKE